MLAKPFDLVMDHRKILKGDRFFIEKNWYMREPYLEWSEIVSYHREKKQDCLDELMNPKGVSPIDRWIPRRYNSNKPVGESGNLHLTPSADGTISFPLRGLPNVLRKKDYLLDQLPCGTGSHEEEQEQSEHVPHQEEQVLGKRDRNDDDDEEQWAPDGSDHVSDPPSQSENNLYEGANLIRKGQLTQSEAFMFVACGGQLDSAVYKNAAEVGMQTPVRAWDGLFNKLFFSKDMGQAILKNMENLSEVKNVELRERLIARTPLLLKEFLPEWTTTPNLKPAQRTRAIKALATFNLHGQTGVSIPELKKLTKAEELINFFENYRVYRLTMGGQLPMSYFCKEMATDLATLAPAAIDQTTPMETWPNIDCFHALVGYVRKNFLASRERVLQVLEDLPVANSTRTGRISRSEHLAVWIDAVSKVLHLVSLDVVPTDHQMVSLLKSKLTKEVAVNKRVVATKFYELLQQLLMCWSV
jgi:hypothetical protein